MSAPLRLPRGQDTVETEPLPVLPAAADDPSLLGASPSRDLLIHCSGPEQEAEVVGCSSNKAAWIVSTVGSQPPALIHGFVVRGHSA